MMGRLLAVLAVVVMALSVTSPAFAWTMPWDEDPPPSTAVGERQAGQDTHALTACLMDPERPGCDTLLRDTAGMLGTSYAFLESEYVALLRAAEAVASHSAGALADGMLMVGPIGFALWLCWIIAPAMLSPLADGGEGLKKMQKSVVHGLFWLALAASAAAAGAFGLYWEAVGLLYQTAAGISDALLAGVYTSIGAQTPQACASTAGSVAEIGGCAVSVVGSIWDTAIQIALVLVDNIGIMSGAVFLNSLLILGFLLAMGAFVFLSFMKLLDRILLVLFAALLMPVFIWGLPYEKGRTIIKYCIGFALAASMHFIVISVLIALMTSLISAELAQITLDGSNWMGNLSAVSISRIIFVSVFAAFSLGAVDKMVDKVVEPFLGQAGGGSLTGAVGKGVGMAVGVATSRPAMAAAKSAMGGLK